MIAPAKALRLDVDSPLVVTGLALATSGVIVSLGALVAHPWPIPFLLRLLVAGVLVLFVSWQRSLPLALAISGALALVVGAPMIAPLGVLAIAIGYRIVSRRA